MKDHTIERVIDALQGVLKQVGIQSIEEAAPMLDRVVEALLQLKQYCNRERLTEVLRSHEVSPEVEMIILASAENFPTLALALVREALPMIMKDFPSANAGRPNSLTIEDKKAVCKYVADLYGDGVELKIAKQRAADKFGVSVSTISRAWADRREGHKPSVNEMVKMITAKATENKMAAASQQVQAGVPSGEGEPSC